MAKMKMNERKDYTLGKNDVITYKKSRIPRQSQIMVLRGPGLNVQDAIEENEGIKKLALRRRFKTKFMQAKTNEDIVAHLKDANTWATGVVFNLGSLVDDQELIKKTIKKLLIPTLEIREDGKISSMMEGVESLLNKEKESP